jgi:hypothetical protein
VLQLRIRPANSPASGAVSQPSLLSQARQLSGRVGDKTDGNEINRPKLSIMFPSELCAIILVRLCLRERGTKPKSPAAEKGVAVKSGPAWNAHLGSTGYVSTGSSLLRWKHFVG